MSCAEDDIDQIRKFFHDFRQGAENVFDPLVGRQEAEGQENMLPFHAELVLVEIGIDERHVDDAVRDDIDLLPGHAVNLAQHFGAALAHHHEARGEHRQLVNHPALVRARIFKDRVKGSDNRYPQVAQKRQNKAARRAAINPVLMLQTNHVRVAEFR